MEQTAILNFLKNLRIDSSVKTGSLAEYVYLLNACSFPATVNGGKFNRQVSDCYRWKLSLIKEELKRRIARGTEDVAAAIAGISMLSSDNPDTRVVMLRDNISTSWAGEDDRYVLICVISSLADARFGRTEALRRKVAKWLNGKEESGDTSSLLYFEVACRYFRLYPNKTRYQAVVDAFADFLNKYRLSDFSSEELIQLHGLSAMWYDYRRAKGLEVYTRYFQRDIAAELEKRENSSVRSRLLTLTESLEAANYAALLGLNYGPGEIAQTFNRFLYQDDESLIRYIGECSRSRRFLARENLIKVADYLQTHIIDRGDIENHLELVSSILMTDKPYFSYPNIVSSLSKAVGKLSKAKTIPQLLLAIPYRALGKATGIGAYITRFEKILRHCYYTLADNKQYPDLGLSTDDPATLALSLNLLNDNRTTLAVLSERYNVDSIVEKYSYINDRC